MNGLRKKINDLIVETVAAENDGGFFRPPRIGIAEANDTLFDQIPFLVGPHHAHPRDILPQAASVISFFLPFSKMVVKSNQGTGPVSPQWGWSYLRANDLINQISQSVVELAIDQGGLAALVPATHTFDVKTLKAGWSHRSAALVAGLGRFGINRMLIGPNGGAGRFGTVFISQPLEPDQRQRNDYCLYLKNGKCRACLKVCPAGALRHDAFDGHKCYDWLLTSSKHLDLNGRLADVCGKCVVAGPCAYIDCER